MLLHSIKILSSKPWVDGLQRLTKIYKSSCFKTLGVSAFGDETQEVGKCTCLVHGDKSIWTIKYIQMFHVVHVAA
jgi:hypothetical protein